MPLRGYTAAIATAMAALALISAPRDARAEDSDGDGLEDGWELAFFGDLSQGALDDPDDDDLPNSSEALWGTDPTVQDTDEDGLSDGLELGNDGDADPLSITNPIVADTDGDGLPDGVEDRDHDGMPDSDETDPLKFDTDADAIDDGAEVGPIPGKPLDTDEDGIIDALDSDSDGDGISDLEEAGDKLVSTPPADTDSDGIPDYRDLDSDGDAILDSTEQQGDANKDGLPDPDADQDDIPNRLDLDSDSDGKSDLIEGEGDQDSDGIPNYLDPDDENPFEDPPCDPVTDPDCDPTDPVDPVDPTDLPCDPTTSDCDPTDPVDPTGPDDPSDPKDPEDPGDPRDPTSPPKDPGGPFVGPGLPTNDDLDGDGLTNDVEFALGTNILDADTDGDSIPDGVEVGDSSDPDDTDSDGYIDALDLDSDSDAIPDIVEAGEDGKEPQDTDGDSEPDYKDLDSDADGLTDRVEVTVTMTSPVEADTDGGTVPDGVEVARGTDPLDPSDDLPTEPEDPWAGAQLQGGVACSSVSGRSGGSIPTGGPALVLLGLAVLLLARRRRTDLTAATLAVVLAFSPVAEGQSGIDSQTLHLTAAGTSLLGNHTADTLGQWGYTATVSSQFQQDPLVVVRDGEILRRVMAGRLDLTTHGAVGLLRWLDVGFDVPVVAYVDGLTIGDATIGGSGLGDVRVWTKAMALHQARFGVDLGFVATLGVPTGDPEALTGAGEVTFDGAVLLGGKLAGGLRLGLSLGYRVAPSAPSAGALQFLGDDRITFSVAGSYRHRGTALTGTVRVFGATRAFSPFEELEETNLEAIASIAWNPAWGLALEAGGGAGLMPGAGTPTYRVFAQVGWSMPNRPEMVPEAPSDRDGDGIIDREDDCPDDPEDRDGFEDSDGCPDPDNDEDGILDAQDDCPDEPEDKDAFEDEDGCPDLDNDKDGIPDLKDKCPLKPETKNGIEDDDGCPDKALVEYDPEAGRIRILLEAMVHFDWNADDVPDQYKAVLKQVAHVMKVHPEIKLLRVEGHTSWTGDHAWNMELSRRRAATVTGWLMHFGLQPERVIARGYGFTQLRVKKRGPKFNWVNRRVEFVIVDPAPKKQKDEAPALAK